ncbi:MAG: phage antirepressor KilAC domain-containing protein [Ruminococcus sp.]|nr:phage antirepressor KilAC domain-containing protein [Ruminococcus sp.]
MNDIMTFDNEEFGTVRTAIINNEPWFVLADVCKILGIGNSRMVSDRLDEDELMSVKLTSGGQRRNMTVVNESGLYAVILRSNKPQAHGFRKWVTADILPTIRKTGGYVNDADKFVETYLPFADEPTKNLFKIQFEYINQLNDRIRRDEPKVRFADHVSDTVNLIDMNEMAKLCADHGIRIGRTRLFAWLRSKGILMAGNLPYQEYIERGYFRVKESVFDYCGEPKTYQQTLVTGKGQQYILARIMREGTHA